MKILLQDTETKLYLGRGGKWTNIPEGALAFLDEVRAQDYSVYHQLPHTQVSHCRNLRSQHLRQ